MVPLVTTGLFGKIPLCGDFVRVRAADPAAQAFAVWLEEASECAKRVGASPRAEPIRFVFSSPLAASALVGVLGKSADRVGRSFPLAIYAVVDGDDLARSFPSVPAALRVFLGTAAGLLSEAASLTPRELPALLARLPWPSPEAFGHEEALCAKAARRERANAVMARLLGEAAAGQHRYALHCLRCACHPLRGCEPPRHGIALDCPAQWDLDRWTWLELVRRSLGWRSPPAFFWLEGSVPRLIVSLGAPPVAVLAALWEPGHRDNRIWPLTTSQASAIQVAARALGPLLLDALDAPEMSVWDLVVAVPPR
ncbi:MAG TPA: type VI secretion system-associated protein TagF [Anaeromyxobacteraceae bacterium]|nr:type VI secretion system-associated protein TagF [Anaeromyxobacteraceae bacterium]